jgi:hypothetical protein
MVMIKCKICKEEKKHEAFGLCRPCYMRKKYKAKPQICPHCGKKFRDKRGLSTHLKVRNDPQYKKKLQDLARNLGKSHVGDKHYAWKGDNVGYYPLHAWIRKNKPKDNFCNNCGKNKPLEAANISGKYKRDINDYKWLCRKCHMNSDNRISNLIQGMHPGIIRDKKSGKFKNPKKDDADKN